METGGQAPAHRPGAAGQALDLPAGGRAQLAVALSFAYRDLAAAWPALQAALRGRGVRRLGAGGHLRAEVHGFPIQLPVRTRRTFGTAP